MTELGIERGWSHWKPWLLVFAGFYWYIEGHPSGPVDEWATDSWFQGILPSLESRNEFTRPGCQDLENCHLGIQGRSIIGAAFHSAGMPLKSAPLCNSLRRPPWKLAGRPSRFLHGKRFWAAGRAQQRVLRAYYFRAGRDNSQLRRAGLLEEEET